MKRKIVGISIGIVFLMLLIPMNSIVGGFQTGTVKSDSPLFLYRLKQHIDTKQEPVITHFIRNDFEISIHLSYSSALRGWVSRGIQTFDQNRDLIVPLVRKLMRQSEITDILQKSDTDAEQVFIQVLNQPEYVERYVAEALTILETQDVTLNEPPEPLGFSGQPGCLIAFFIVLPIIIMIGTMIATFTIITCLNINSCFETIMQNIFEGFSQGLQPG